VVEHHVQDDLDAALVGLAHQQLELVLGGGGREGVGVGEGEGGRRGRRQGREDARVSGHGCRAFKAAA
jgi:hypothetical protein